MATSGEDNVPPLRRVNSMVWVPPNMSDLRIVLIGKSGSGKSSSANTILGREEFESRLSQRSVTKRSQRADAEVDGRSVSVVDTPGLFSDSLSHDEVRDEMIKSISLLDPGPNVFLLVSNIDCFTEEDGKTLEQIREVFGRAAERFTIVLFTRGDKLKSMNMTIEEFTENDCPDFMKKLIQDCGGRYHMFDNQDEGNRSQVSELMTKIEDMLQTNGGGFYTNQMLQERHEEEQAKWIEREEVRVEMEDLQRTQIKEKRKGMDDEKVKNEEETKLRSRRVKELEKSINKGKQDWKQQITALEQKIESGSKEAVKKQLEEIREDQRRERENWRRGVREWWKERYQEKKQKQPEGEMKLKMLQKEYERERGIYKRREEKERIRGEEEEAAMWEFL